MTKELNDSPLGKSLDELAKSRQNPEDTKLERRRKIGRSFDSPKTKAALDELKNFENEVKAFNKSWGNIKGEFRIGLNDFDWDTTEIENIRDKVSKNNKSLDVIDLDSINKKSMALTKALTKIRGTAQAIESAALAKKLSTNLASLESRGSKNWKPKAIRGIAFFGGALLVADAYGNILRFQSGNPEPDVWPLQIGAEVLLKGADTVKEEILRIATGKSKTVSQEERGSVDELDPSTEKKH